MDFENFQKLSDREKFEIYSKLLRDSVTGLKNNNACTQEKNSMNEFIAKGGCASVFLIDLNCLKAVNDDYGHAAGDKYIKAFGDAMIDTYAVSIGLLEYDEKGELVLPRKKKGKKKGETDEQQIERIKTEIRGDTGHFRIGGDEFQIFGKNKPKSIFMTQREYKEQIEKHDHKQMKNVQARLEFLWEKERVNIKGASGVCDIKASFSYGVVNTLQEKAKGLCMDNLKSLADRMAYYHKGWLKLSGQVAPPPGRTWASYEKDRRLKGIGDFKTFEDMLEYTERKEEAYVGQERRKLNGGDNSAVKNAPRGEIQENVAWWSKETWERSKSNEQ